jgi:hypothetical protein
MTIFHVLAGLAGMFLPLVLVSWSGLHNLCHVKKKSHPEGGVKAGIGTQQKSPARLLNTT